MAASQLRRQVGWFGWLAPAALFSAALFAQNAPPAQNSGVVEGIVVNSVTQVGIAGVKVEMAPEGGSEAISTTTGGDGRFRVDNLAPGKYSASFEHDGFADPQSDGEATVTFTVGSAGGDTSIRAELMPRASLRGRLLDPEGKPMPGVQVQLLRLRYPGEYQSTTNDKGEFAFANVRPTAYVIVVEPPESPPPPAVKAGHDLRWLRTFYPGVAQRLPAPPVVIPAGGELGGFDIHMQAGPAFRITGKVLDTDGKPAVKAPVRLRSTDDDHYWPVQVETSNDGTFAFDGVPAGSWRAIATLSKLVKVQPKGPTITAKAIRIETQPDGGLQNAGATGPSWTVILNSPRGGGTDPVLQEYAARTMQALDSIKNNPPADDSQPRVSADDESGAKNKSVDFVILVQTETKRGSATIAIQQQDPEPVEIHVSESFQVPFAAERRDNDDSKPQPSVGSVRIEPLDNPDDAITADSPWAGERRFENVFTGRYRVAMEREDPGNYLSAVMLGDRDVLGQVFDLMPGSPELRAIFRPNPGSVRGTVEGSNHATIVLLPVDESLRGVQAAAKTQCDANGRFEIGGLRPGEYYILAFERVDIEALKDAAFVRTFAQRAERVTVERGGTAPVRLSVTPWPE